MSTWNALFSAMNPILLAPGEPVVYQPLVSGIPSGSPVTLSAIRRNRAAGESGLVGNFEEIDIDPTLLPDPPLKGDIVTAWGLQFTVTTTRQANPYGLTILTLMQRAGPAV